MKSKALLRMLFGILCLTPTLFILTHALMVEELATFLGSLQHVRNLKDGFVSLLILATLLCCVVVGKSSSPQLTGKKLLWITVLVLGNVLTVPVFWLLHGRKLLS